MSSCGLRSKGPRPCMSQSVQGIGSSFVVYLPILERGGTEVCIGTTAMVAGLVAEMEENEISP